MSPKFSKIPASSAPEWMCNLQKTKFLKYAEMKENNFQFVLGTIIVAKARCEFTVLFYTLFDGGDAPRLLRWTKQMENFI